MKKEYDLIILTTAINRPDLHKNLFPKNCEFVGDLNCLWLINIDYIGVGDSLDETESSFIDILSKWDNIDFQIFTNENGGTRKAFYTASQIVNNCLLILVLCSNNSGGISR